MRAAQIKNYGHADAIEVVEVEIPKLSEGKVLIKVYASSLNPFDSMVREGYLKQALPLDLPITLGGDIAGVLEEVGAGVSNVKVGDKVYGQANVVAGQSGALAEYAVTSASSIALSPGSLNFDQSASLPLVGVSAVQAITEHLELKAGQKIFIHGGAGGIGSIAIQIAKYLGAYIATTATGEGIEFVTKLGADEVIDYKTKDFSTILQDYDAVFELAGGKEFDKTLKVLKPGGKAVSMNATVDEALAEKLGVDVITQSTKVTTERLNKLTKLVEDGAVSPRIEKVYALDHIQDAFTVRESGDVNGKIVISIQ